MTKRPKNFGRRHLRERTAREGIAWEIAQHGSGAPDITTILSRAGFEPADIPPTRREWFAAFMEECRCGFEQAEADGAPSSSNSWSAIEYLAVQMFEQGVAAYVLTNASTAFDPDYKDRRRGWDWGALDNIRDLPRDKIRDILQDVIEARDPSAWCDYPRWLRVSHVPETIPWMRGSAVKFMPQFTKDGFDAELLHDPERLVRFMTAMNCAEAGYAVTPTLVQVLESAASDADWIWSSDNPHDDIGWTTRHEALERLLKVAPRSEWARARYRVLIDKERNALAGLDDIDRRVAERQLARLRDGLAQAAA